MDRTLIFLLISPLMISCATYDPKTGTYKKENSLPKVKNEVDVQGRKNAEPLGLSGGGPWVGALAGVAGLIQLSSYAPDHAKPNGIFGRCTEQVSSTDKETKKISVETRPCEKTYVNIVNVNSGKIVKVWIDEGGSFSFNAPKGNSYSLQAFKEIERTKPRTSDILTITTPREVRVSISEPN